MKKLILLFAAMLFAVNVNLAGDFKGRANGDDKCAYCCPKCHHCSDKAGECSKDKCAMVKNGTYCCKKDMTTSEVEGKCPKCGKSMHKVECKKGAEKK
ncbi:MAG: hypothetical protein H0W61_10915 [Bacteroidetes bacterium]|nr:hypothetical protein [Bacteroidota bacterium]